MAQPTGGTLIANPVRPNDLLDAMATAFANEVKGGNHGYATITERDAIIVERREWGMFCTIFDNLTDASPDATINGTYVLSRGVADTNLMTNGNWVKTSIPSGSGNGGTPGVGGDHVIEDEGTPLAQQDTINFTGDGVTVTDAAGKTVVDIPGGSGTFDGDSAVLLEIKRAAGLNSLQQAVASVPDTSIQWVREDERITVYLDATLTGSEVDEIRGGSNFSFALIQIQGTAAITAGMLSGYLTNFVDANVTVGDEGGDPNFTNSVSCEIHIGEFGTGNPPAILFKPIVGWSPGISYRIRGSISYYLSSPFSGGGGGG